MSHQDHVFADVFKAVVTFLVILTIVILLVALFIGSEQQTAQRQDPLYQKSVEERIAPVGRVNLGVPGATPSAVAATSAPPGQAAGAPAPAATTAAPATDTASSGAPDLAQGEQVYTKACVACHGTGVVGAPKVNDQAAWTPRAAQGFDTLVQHAIQGLNAMPPKGGNPSLSDQEVRSAIAYMLEQAGIKAGQGTASAPTAPPTASAPAAASPETSATPVAPEPASPEQNVTQVTEAAATAEQPAAPAGESPAPPTPAAEAQPPPQTSAQGLGTEPQPAPAEETAAAKRPKGQYDLARGAKVYSNACLTCHRIGAMGAPKLGDKAAWAPRIAQGMDRLATHAIEGFQGTKGVMPPKGGYIALSDAEVEDAVAYMVQQSK